MSQSEVFRPSNGPLLVRGSITEGPQMSFDVFKKRSSIGGLGSRPATQGGYRFGQLSHNSFFARHNPHPGRVRHLKGLLDVPICSVNDDGYFANPRYSLNFPPNNFDQSKISKSSKSLIPVNAINVNSTLHPVNTVTGLQNFLGKPLNFRVFREKAIPKMGMVPVTEAWRDELRALTEACGLAAGNLPKPGRPATMEARPHTSQYSTETGRLIPPPSRAMSRGSSRAASRNGFINKLQHITEEPDMENMVLQMLCQILQTDDVNAVQSWLVSAGDREKTAVLDMIRAALSSNDDYYNQRPAEYAEPKIDPLATIGGENADRLTLSGSPTPVRPATSSMNPFQNLPGLDGDGHTALPDVFQRPNMTASGYRPSPGLDRPRTESDNVWNPEQAI